MTTVEEGRPKFGCICGYFARVTTINDRVVIRAVGAMMADGAVVAMTPDQARALAAGIVAAADNAEGKK